MAADVRRIIEMVHAPASATSAATSRPPTSWPRSTARCSTSTPPTDPRARPLHPEQGPRAGALYTTLAACGLLPGRAAGRYMAAACRRSTATRTATRCPASRPTPARSATGCPVAVGHGIAAKLRRLSRAAPSCVMGDGELQEGSNWEAAMTAGHYGLDNLTVIVDRNRLQQGARTEETNALEPLADKSRAFGWAVREIDGHDYRAAAGGLRRRAADRQAGRAASSPTRSRARASRSWRTASSGTTRSRRTSRSQQALAGVDHVTAVGTEPLRLPRRLRRRH